VTDTFDVVIAGGGPVGAAFALASRGSGLNVALVEPQPLDTSDSDARSLALSRGSRLILERLGIWPAIAGAATAINDIHVSQQGAFGRAHLSAAEQRLPALGYVVSYNALARALRAALNADAAELITGSKVVAVTDDHQEATLTLQGGDSREQLKARLAVIADGGVETDGRDFKHRDYGQCALVFEIVSERPHLNRAFERFTAQGPLALLPTARGWSVVWTLSTERAHDLAALDDAAFCRQLERTFGHALGRYSGPTPRALFPLKLKYATQPAVGRTVVIGNAAQTLHPVAGQGFNLGLRDAWELACALCECNTPDVGDVLKAYVLRRRRDRFTTILFTDTLIRLFCKDNPIAAGARSIGLAAFGAIPFAKSFLSRRMMFGARG
jgi:2-octaprenyl-6-methoxyphenol hydroxylase